MDFELTMVISINNISPYSLDKIRYLRVFAFHQSKVLNSTPFSEMRTFSSKYVWKSDLIDCCSVSTFLINES
jgi:hypothetical protein